MYVCTRACAGVAAHNTRCPVATHTYGSELVDFVAEKASLRFPHLEGAGWKHHLLGLSPIMGVNVHSRCSVNA